MNSNPNSSSEKDLDLVMQARVDKSSDAIQKLKNDINEVEKRLKDTSIKIDIELNDGALKNLKSHFETIQSDMELFKKSGAFDALSKEMESSLLSAEQMSATLSELNKQKELVATRHKFNLITGEDIQQIETYRKNLLEIEKIVTSKGKDGSTLKTQEVSIDREKAQRSLYADIKSLLNEIYAIDKQIIKATDDQKASLLQQKAVREDLIKSSENMIKQYSLSNEAQEDSIRLAKQLKDIQLQIAKDKDTDQQSRAIYTELNKLAREEFAIKKNIEKVDGEQLEVLKQKLELVLDARDSLESQISSDSVLHNEEKHNALLENRKKLQLDLLSVQEKLAERERIRVEKLNEKVGDVDFSSVGFSDDKAINDFITQIYGADATVKNFARTMSNAGLRQVELTVSTKESSNAVREYKVVVDEATGGIYQLSESLKTANRSSLDVLSQMTEAIKKSVIWAFSMNMIYGNIRRFTEGVEIVRSLDWELTQVSITTGKTREETKKLGEEYATLGKEMGKTVAEISKTNTELIRQGLEATESMERMQTILKFSATSGMETSQSLSIITSSVNALGESAEKTADVLLKAGEISASSAEEIGESLTKTASSAKATNTTLEQTSAILAGLIDVTQESPSSLGNSLKTLISRFNKIDETTGEVNESFNDVQKAFESVGVSFTDSEGQIRPFFDLLEDMDKTWGNLDKNTRMYIATQSAGKQISCPLVW